MNFMLLGALSGYFRNCIQQVEFLLYKKIICINFFFLIKSYNILGAKFNSMDSVSEEIPNLLCNAK